MHEEWYTIPVETAEKINKAKKEGRPILAVGTTSVRTLESAAKKIIDEGGIPGNNGEWVQAGTTSTSIFMYPGYKFNVVDKMFTNFHTPESTLIMLVSAFAGKDNILNAYKKAVINRLIAADYELDHNSIPTDVTVEILMKDTFGISVSEYLKKMNVKLLPSNEELNSMFTGVVKDEK